jgi:alcohol dehydrogenase class IV
MLPEYFEFSLPTKLIYGVGILGNLGASLQPFGKRKALLVTDEVLVETGLVEKVKAGFAGSQIDIAGDVRSGAPQFHHRYG